MERRELAKRLGGSGTAHAGQRQIAIETADAAEFARQFADAVATEAEIFLVDPAWGPTERAKLAAWLDLPPTPVRDRGWLMIPTGGSSGGMKFARHDGFTLAAAVRGFTRHFGIERVNAVGVLPLHHVSGLLAWLRCVLTGGEYVAWDWKRLEAGDWPVVGSGDRVISLVPTQLDRLLKQPTALERLREFRVVFLGGAPAWPELLDRAAAARVPLSLSYGMTETAAMVTATTPEEFLAGERSSGAALPHARVELGPEGEVQISGSSLFRGYFPEWRHERKFFVTADVGTFDARRRLTVLGRRDAVIISGGEKVQPAEVEAALRAAAGTPDFAIVGLPDAEWGERVVCVFPAGAGFPVESVRAAAAALTPAQRPKAYLALAEWPRNAAGKLNRARLRELATRA